MLRALCAFVVACWVLAGCGPDAGEPDPDLSSARTVAWTNTAKELSGGLSKAKLYGFGGDDMGGATSVASGDLVLSGAWTDRVVVIAAQSAKTGEIVWRRTLPTGKNGWADCADDDKGGPVFACKIGGPTSAALWIMADRTGAVRKKLLIKPETAFGLSGDDVYLAGFSPNRENTTLHVDVERRSWATGKTLWTQETSFAIDGWGHDGDTGFEFGRNRVVAFSAAWQVILDKASGRLLDRSDQGRWESELSNGGRVVLDSGDGTSEHVRVTLFSPDGRPIAEVKSAVYPAPYEVDPDRIVIGRRILSLATGRTVFEAPKRTHIVAVASAGRLAVVEPDEFEFRKNRIPLTIHDTSTGKKTGTVALKGNVSETELTGGNGVVKLVGHYDDRSDETLPSTLEIFDVRKPTAVQTVRVGQRGQELQWVTLVKTSAGFAATGGGAVRGFVATD
jgi:hypothetical protein